MSETYCTFRSLLQKATEIIGCAIDTFITGECAVDMFQEFHDMVFGSDSPLYEVVRAGGICTVPEDFGMSLPIGYGIVVPRECEILPTCNVTAGFECLSLIDAAANCG